MGAKFSSGSGATVFYDDGPITAPSGEQGTQRTEFKAAIKSVTSSTTVGAVFVYDTRNDSDSGAWRKKTSHTSWAREAASATRSSRSEFPSVALIVADNDTSGSSVHHLDIYDLDDPSAPLWLRTSTTAQASPYHDFWRGGRAVSSIAALNGRVYFGTNVNDQVGVKVLDFAEDRLYSFGTTSSREWSGYFSGGIADRNSDSKVFLGNTLGAIVHRDVNDVAATVLEGAEIGALGLPEVTIGVATNGGASVIHGGSGAVYNISSSSTHNDFHKIFFTDDNRVGVGFESNSTYDIASYVGLHAIPYADNTGVSSSAGWSELYNPTGYGGLVTATAAAAHTNSAVNAVVPTSEKGLAIGYPVGLAVVKRNAAKDSEGMVANITSDYTTGYQIGAAKGTWLTGGDASAEGRYDRSVGNTDLVENGTVLHAAAETDAEVTKYYNFSSSTYFSQAHNSDFDFTGDFSVTLWFKDATTSDPFVTRLENSTSAGKGFVISTGSGGQISFAIYTQGFQSTGRTSVATSAVFTGSLGWKQLVATRRSGKMYLYIDGVSQGTPQPESTDLTDSDAPLGIGIDYALGTGFGGSLSLVRISATAPTPQQIKEIYEAEKPLFRAGAKCLLAANQVNDLAYDNSTNLLHVASESTSSSKSFRGLEAVESLTSDGSLGLTAATEVDGITAAGGVLAAYDSAKVGVNLPAFDVRGDTNIADTKLPDDGKLHFSGVTTDATQTVIGQIPIAENERYKVSLTASGETWPPEAGHWIDVTMEESFFRLVGANVLARGEASKLSNETLASMDIDLVVDTGANTIQVKVTGVASTRIAWAASVEVQRITERSYER